MLKLGNVTFDCENPARVAEFWGTALGYTVQNVNEGFSMATHPEGHRPMLLFIKVPEARTVKNRMHLDMAADDREAEIERLIGLGATRGETHTMPEYNVTHTMPEYNVTWTVLQDPEGNEFCVAQSR
jgi:predicted enzyme related to lactoylglutathione lyase